VITKEQLIDALVREYEHLCHDDFDPEEDPTPEEYRGKLEYLEYDELVEETGTDDTYTLGEYLDTWSSISDNN